MTSENILLSNNLVGDLNSFLTRKSYSQIAVLVDEHSLKHCYPILQDHLPDHSIIEIPSGEENKNLETCSHIWQGMTELGLDRHAVLIIIGGGVLGDMGGFCAACFKRGIDFILLPTTLLAQVDASIGGKTGVDFMHFKNHIGAFNMPVLTLLYKPFLDTLPKAELRSGFAEVIKHILISDATLWNEIRTRGMDGQDWPKLIAHSIEFKSSIVKEDPREKGLRKILNAGHTIGHALESYFLSRKHRVLHGEAISAGLICEAYIANQKGMLDQRSLNEISEYILSVFGKIDFSESQIEIISELVIQDKKNVGNRILGALLDGIGKSRWDCEISPAEVKRALSFYRSLQM